MATFEELFITLENYGLTDALLPFLLIFAIVFALMEKIKMFGDDKRNIHAVVSLVIGLLVVIPHVTNSYPPGADVVDIMNSAIPNVSVFIVALIMGLLLIGVFGGQVKWAANKVSGFIALIMFLIILIIFGGAAGWWDDFTRYFDWWGTDTTAIIIIVLVLFLVVWFITHDPKESKKTPGDDMVKQFGELFKK